MDLLFDNQDNQAGILSEAYIVDLADVQTIPAMAAVDDLSITADIVLATNKAWDKVYNTSEKGKADANTVGENDGRSKENMIELFHPGNDKAVAAFERKYMNANVLILYKETDGLWRVLGLSNLDRAGTVLEAEPHCKMSDSPYSSGAASADARGTTFIFRHPCPHRPLQYAGAIDTDIGT
jgi:hypothetical protein